MSVVAVFYIVRVVFYPPLHQKVSDLLQGWSLTSSLVFGINYQYNWKGNMP